MDIRTGVSTFGPGEGLRRLAGFPFALLSWVGVDGYPVTAAVDFKVTADEEAADFIAPAGLDVPTDRELSLTGSHIRPQPGVGYDERRHVTVWGTATPTALGGFSLRPTAAWGWDESTIPFPEYVERQVGQSRRYLGKLSAELGRPIRPRLSFGWLVLRATRLPFLSATLIPVFIGLAIAARQGFFDLPSAILTAVGAAAVHLGLNVLNDVFDARLGADDKNVNPTKYSGGSRVIQYGLVPLRRMELIAFGLYAITIAIGVLLLLLRPSPALLAIGVVGILLSVSYTAPPVKLVYRGLGEIAVAIGFGPLMLVGAYVVQSGGSLTPEPFIASIPIALLVALILYVNEIPDRAGDARAGKHTVPVRLPRGAVLNIYVAAAAGAFAAVVAGVVAGVLPLPALLALLALPLLPRIVGGLRQNYESPYGLMAVMATNIRLHMYVGGLLLIGYLIALAARFAFGLAGG